MMRLFFKRPVLANEQYRLISAIELARKQMRLLQRYRLAKTEGTTAHIPVLLAELRYRFLLHQARQKKWSNEWHFD